MSSHTQSEMALSNTPTKVLVVNDSPMLTAVLKAIMATEPKYQVIGNAEDGVQAIQFFQLQPADVVLMDLHMPNMSGVKATQEIMLRWPKTCVLIVTATVTVNMGYIFTALNSGALDYVQTPTFACKPGTRISEQELRSAGRPLLQKLSSLHKLNLRPAPRSIQPAATVARQQTANVALLPEVPKVVAIGCSTGGPKTLVNLLSRIPNQPPCPIIICQHIEPGFSGDFAQWLEGECGIPTVLGKHQLAMEPGHLYLAPAGFNTKVTASGRLAVTPPDEGQFFTPNVNVLFTSLAEHFADRALGVVLTGMGSDGSIGAKKISAQGGSVLTQDSESAIIDSMPLNTRRALGIDLGYPPDKLAATMAHWMNSRHTKRVR